ncbi:non-specific lipid transfer protein GPI-anchored 19-like [Benincasa hispida]|uniref:non-specific lipid transfer protein GPI-anchored 19-like n=1 Tax=Benincasa hispida TaxID=102211 RepID=UPI0018FFAEA6|nr:non-specific lipid transfer protein GPI-anchored 19-like [Benincasa hispida]
MGINESIILVVVVGLSMSHGSLGQSSGCTTALISLSPCLTYITATGTTSPSSSCCSRLATVVQSQPRCLCSALNGGAAASLGVTINQTRALALPAACRLQTPPPTRCNDNGNGGEGPIISPISSSDKLADDEEVGEAPSTPATTWESSFPSAIGSDNVPITKAIPSGGWSLINSPFYHLINLSIFLISMLL